MKAFNDIEYEDINCPICNSVNLEKKFEATLGKNEVPLIGYDSKTFERVVMTLSISSEVPTEILR